LGGERPNDTGPERDTFSSYEYNHEKWIDRVGCFMHDHSGNIGGTASWKKDVGGGLGSEDSCGGVPPPPLLSIAIFSGDGSFTTTGNTKISLPGLADQRGAGYGRWAQTGDREFKLTFYAVLLKEGEVHGYLRVRSTMILSDSGNEFTARECQVEFLDANWKVVDSDNDEVKGTRLETP
jgi:hypothetical protein